MDSTLSMRPFQVADTEELTGLLHAAYAELGATGLDYAALDPDPRTTRDRPHGGRCWVVRDSGTVVGTLTMSMPPSAELRELTSQACRAHRAWLDRLAVVPGPRRLGIASGLWRRGWQWARDAGAESIGLDAPAPGRHLLRMYEAWGFTRVDTIRRPGATCDSAVMTRPLVPPGG